MTDHSTDFTPRSDNVPDKAQWGAVASLFTAIFTLVASQFAPAGLLTPLAQDLQITEGLAGQAISATAVVGLMISLLTARLLGNINRKAAVMGLTAILILSDLIVALAPGPGLLIAGRLLLGITVGGLWSLAPSLAARLVPPHQTPRALAVIFAGVSVATVAVLPLATALEPVIGWRGIFWCFTGLASVALLLQMLCFPSLTAYPSSARAGIAVALKQPGMKTAIATMLFCFSGHFALYTFIRPLLQQKGGFDAGGVAGIFFLYGFATLLGNFAAVRLMKYSLPLMLRSMPVVIGVVAVVLMLAGSLPFVTTLMVILWGLAYSALPVGWTTFVTRAAPDTKEAAGGLFVATSSLSVTLGVSLGGGLYDASGINAVCLFSAFALLISVVICRAIK